MEGADSADVEAAHLLQRLIDLHAVAAADVDVVAAAFGGPVVGVGVVGAELHEAVSGEHHLVAVVVGHEHLGPVHHRCGDEAQRAAAQREGASVGHSHRASFEGEGVVELVDEGDGFGRGHEGERGIALHHLDDGAGVVGLDVLDDEVVGRAVGQGVGEVVHPLVGASGVDGVHHGHLLVEDDVAVVAHAFGHFILAFEEVEIAVVGADILDSVGDVGFHKERVRR